MNSFADHQAAIAAGKALDALLIILDRITVAGDLTQAAATLDNYEADEADHTLAVLLPLFDVFNGQIEPLHAALDGQAPGAPIVALSDLFAAVAAYAAAAAKHVLNTKQDRYTMARDDHVAAILRRYIDDSAAAFITTARASFTAPGSAASRARHLRRSIGLSATQGQALEAMRRVLLAYEDIAIVAKAKTRGELITRRLSEERGRLSAPQIARLRKAMTEAITPEASNILLDDHARQLRRYRAELTTRHAAHHAAEHAKLTGWQIAQYFGALPATARRDWITAGDEAVRQSHDAVATMNPNGVALAEPFHTPFGDVMAAPLEIGCRCRAVLRTGP